MVGIMKEKDVARIGGALINIHTVLSQHTPGGTVDNLKNS
jgi:hypothetical protein